MPADNVCSFDYTNRLGFAKMPPGYLLIGLDSGHFLFERRERRGRISYSLEQVGREGLGMGRLPRTGAYKGAKP